MIAMIVFIVLFVLALIARLTLGAYVGEVAWFQKLLEPLTWLTVIFGIVAFVLICIKVIEEILKLVKEFRK